MPLRNISILLIVAVISTVCRVEARRTRYSSALSSAFDTIRDSYFEEVDARELFEGGVEGMLRGLDPYSSFIRPSEYRQFEDEIRQEFGGIGIEVGIRDDRLVVVSPMPDTPAYRAGMLAGDTILAIGEQDTTGITMQEAVGLIKGDPGTVVELTILHPGEQEPVEISVERAIINVESTRGDRRLANGDWVYTLETNPRIGYVRLSTFATNSAVEVRRILESLDGRIDGLILDLRLNPGGLLDVGIEMCDLFLEEGQTIVSIRQRGGVLQRTFEARDGSILDPTVPIVVLVDEGSASASEILAACLQDHGRATIVGQRTFGKGTVQNVILMERGRSAIRLTTATYWRPSGKNIHRHEGDDETAEWGVQPEPQNRIDIDVEEYRKILQQRIDRDIVQPGETMADGQIADPFIDRALEVLQDMTRKAARRSAA